VEEKKEEESKFLDPKANKFDLETLKTTFPEGVDPTKKEAYLEDKVFEEVFGMPMDKFYEQKKWKQQDQRKKHGLF